MSPTRSTPVTRPVASVTIRSARVPSRTLRFPVAAARASTVLSEPFLASTGQAKPTHCRHRAHAARPSYGVELIASGTGAVVSPIASAPASSRRAGVGEGHRRHRVRPRTPGRPGVGFGGAADPDLVLGLGVERLHVVVADRPVGQRAAVRYPVRARHGEVLGHEPPGLRAVHPGAAAERVGVAAVARVPGRQHDRVRAQQQGARVLRRRAQRPVVQSAVGAGVAQVIASQVGRVRVVATLHQQDRPAGVRQRPGRHPAARTRTHHHGVVVRGHLVAPDDRPAVRDPDAPPRASHRPARDSSPASAMKHRRRCRRWRGRRRTPR